MRKIASLAVMMITAHVVQAQKVTFYSPEFEEGVKIHLGLSATNNVLQAQMDTITHMSLSGLGITDIRDAVYLSVVKELDLSYNQIDDVAPLLSLDSLRVVDLSNNQLESVNVLAMVQKDSMVVDVTNNFISDFSYFFTPTRCEFTFLGMGLQQVKNAPYFDVYQLYADIDDQWRAVACYRGYTNMASTAYVECCGSRRSATMDGGTYEMFVPGNPKQTTQVCLTNCERGDTTWVVPAAVYMVENGQSITIETGLPDTYRLGFLRALHGTVSVSQGNGMSQDFMYQAPVKAVNDTIYLSYFEGSRLRGFGKLFISDGESPVGIEKPASEDPFSLSWQDGELVVTAGDVPIESVAVYDAAGRLLASSSSGSLHIPLHTVSGAIVIVHVTAGGRSYVRKMKV